MKNKNILIVFCALLFVCCSRKKQQIETFNLDCDSIVCSLNIENFKNISLHWRHNEIDFNNIEHKTDNPLMIKYPTIQDTLGIKGCYLLVMKSEQYSKQYRKRFCEYMVRDTSSWTPVSQFSFESDSLKNKMIYCVDLMMKYPIEYISHDIEYNAIRLKINKITYLYMLDSGYTEKYNAMHSDPFKEPQIRMEMKTKLGVTIYDTYFKGQQMECGWRKL